MDERGAMATVATATESDKTPRTERGRRTLRAILDAAGLEFGERGFQGAAITRITARAARTTVVLCALLGCRRKIGKVSTAHLRSKVPARDVRQNMRDFLAT